MHTIDKEGRVKFPEGLLGLSSCKGIRKVVLVQEGENVFKVVPASQIPDDAKVITGEITISDVGRLCIPTMLRKKFSDVKSVQIYVKTKNLYIEF